MPFNKLFGERCARCGTSRSKGGFEGLPTCDACELKIQAKREEKRACPTCAITMSKAVVLDVGIVIDRCPSCVGVWLDGGELDLVKKAMENGGGSDFASGMVLGMAMG